MPGTAQDSGKKWDWNILEYQEKRDWEHSRIPGKTGIGKTQDSKETGMGWGTLVKPQDSRENQDWECQEQPRIPEKQG